VEGIYLQYGADCWITSANDGKHKQGSFHYTDRALDFRLHNVPAVKRANLVRDIKEALGADWDVIWEGAGTENEHLHIEMDS
jgi:hypothetical protein